MFLLSVRSPKKNAGFTLVEAMVALALFAITVIPIYFAYTNILNALIKNRLRQAAIAAVQNQFEVIRNMPYENIGISGGYPPGVIPPSQTISYEGNSFALNATVRNIDDPFDGTAGGNPNDTAPADYKLVEITVNCTTCPNFTPLTMTTTVAPKALESATQNGSLFINVFDASGRPVSLANVHIYNASTNPPITIDDTANINGVLQLVDIPPSAASYQISVSKNNYSSEKTYALGDPQNPNPIKPHATVASGQLTQISFSIDGVSTLNIQSKNEFCGIVPNISFNASGTKLIGISPDILKFSTSSATNANGEKTISNLEWDTYYFNVSSSAYDLSGANPLIPLIVNPSSTYQMNWLLSPKRSGAVLFTVVNQSGALLNDAKIILTKTGFTKSIYTKRREFIETNWSPSNYSSQSGNIDATSAPGKLQLQQTAGLYPTSTEWLISQTIDFGTQSANFHELNWNPLSQPAETGSTSIKFQLASNNDQSAWNFLGPDGTADTFYTSSTLQINSLHNNNRYLRYKLFMRTENENFTPSLEDVYISFSSSCLTDGQTFINGLEAGTYNLTVEKSGYQTLNEPNFAVGGGWQEYKAVLTP